MNPLTKYAIRTLHWHMRFENTYFSSDDACGRLDRAIQSTLKDVEACDYYDVSDRQRKNAINALYAYADRALAIFEESLQKGVNHD